MTRNGFEKLQQFNKEVEELICVEDLSPYIYNKTLLYGYTCERKTFHVYLKNREIYTVVYENDYSTGEAKPKNMKQIKVSSNHDFVPDKRIYPERSDYNFCRALKEKGIELPFTNYDDTTNFETRSGTRYYGFTLEDATETDVSICILCGKPTGKAGLKVCDQCASEYQF